MDELSASRRRVGFGVTLSAIFVVALAVALSSPPASHSLRVDQTASAPTSVPARHPAVPSPASSSSTTTAVPSATLSSHGSGSVTTPTAALTQAVAARSAALANHAVRQAAPTTTAKPVVKAPPPVAAPPPPAAPAPSPSAAAFLACVRQRESHGNYGAVSPGGTYMGAYQFSQSSWDAVARHTGRLDLVGQHPNLVSPGDQDAMALAEYEWLGAGPWGGACT